MGLERLAPTRVRSLNGRGRGGPGVERTGWTLTTRPRPCPAIGRSRCWGRATYQGEITMKRIVVCCDGTWNRADQASPTNVRKLEQAIACRDTKGVKQEHRYFKGVGTGP